MHITPVTDKLIDLALEEDLMDTGDVTSEALFTDESETFNLVSKDRGILCGTHVFERVMKKADRNITIKWNYNDSDKISDGSIVAELNGRVIPILRAERTALNFLSILSGVATKTAKFVKETGGGVTLLDTRKTIPGLRSLQKYAVKCGGGSNHRMGLYDLVMIKDNHIDAAGGICQAVEKVRARWGNRFIIEVEARNITEVVMALNCKVDRIMLDNMNEAEMNEALRIIDNKCETEASGNITMERIPSIAATGVNFISCGSITNSVSAFDFSLKKKITG